MLFQVKTIIAHYGLESRRISEGLRSKPDMVAEQQGSADGQCGQQGT